jgi:hypothetical protein
MPIFCSILLTNKILLVKTFDPLSCILLISLNLINSHSNLHMKFLSKDEKKESEIVTYSKNFNIFVCMILLVLCGLDEYHRRKYIDDKTTEKDSKDSNSIITDKNNSFKKYNIKAIMINEIDQYSIPKLKSINDIMEIDNFQQNVEEDEIFMAVYEDIVMKENFRAKKNYKDYARKNI